MACQIRGETSHICQYSFTYMLWCFPNNNTFACGLCEQKHPIDLEHAISLFPIVQLGDLTMTEVVWVKCLYGLTYLRNCWCRFHCIEWLKVQLWVESGLHNCYFTLPCNDTWFGCHINMLDATIFGCNGYDHCERSRHIVWCFSLCLRIH